MFRHALLALGDAAPHSKREAIQILATRIPFEPSAFLQLLDIRDRKSNRKQFDAKDIFARYLAAVQHVTAAVDTMLDIRINDADFFREGSMVKVLIVIAILALMAFVAFGQYVSVRNTLVTKNEAVKASWSQVDVVLQRRADLIPNLVATVKGIAQQEQTVFGDIAKARSALLSAGTPAGKIAANGQLDGALGRLLAIVENYPAA